MKTNDINEFTAISVNTMDMDTRQAWDSLSDFEKKLIAARAWFFKETYNRQQRLKNIENLQWELIS